MEPGRTRFGTKTSSIEVPILEQEENVAGPKAPGSVLATLFPLLLCLSRAVFAGVSMCMRFSAGASVSPARRWLESP